MTTIHHPGRDMSRRLSSYYFLRAGVSAGWVAAAVTLGAAMPPAAAAHLVMPPAAAALLVAYPAWDAVANVIDARRSGGLAANASQALNAAASTVVAVAVAVALGRGPHAVLAVFGVWAILAGLLQLATGVRRWQAGAQWAMALSGAQSALAGTLFILKAKGASTPGIADIAPYAAFGAFYFLVSAVWLIVGSVRKGATDRIA
ncbi:hypothetical protein SAMN02799631_02191 [Methylobacterium sp. 174MFSha1.1]|uniref:DUF308 domain-containing protein n=1 Tax=Methylobacterium sp. 174MFSha1.1 TaxID=1502749 RepID=UPI0008F23BDA|nr:DUF308 domain-containing protein [Methylobacterium sp. 174MFSha1.1]SFU76508.1 hypothetical protein SAMN02799631_02191 [Methylobacterium sp. 174MFSha1.1]